jgi:hypothetical protein
MKKYLTIGLLAIGLALPIYVAAKTVTSTLASNKKTIALTVGDTFVLKLGTTYSWSFKFSNTKVVQRVPNLALVKGTQGIYKAKTPGTVTVTGVGDPVCRKSKPACGLASRTFKLKIVVRAAPKPNLPATTTSANLQSGNTPMVAGCQIFPADNPWNQDISALPVRSDSATFINSIGLNKYLHPDMGENQLYGIPYVVVDKTQAKVPITFTAYGNESDPGPYPIPNNAPVEVGDDRHLLVLQKGTCLLYEMYNTHKTTNGWSADSGAIFDLSSNKLRPERWTSADAAGLPIFAGLIRYDEVAAGEIKHAIRFTAPRTQKGYIHPAVHYAGSNDTALPPMGLRVRLKADYDISKLTGQAKVIATAMKKYGMILADNGSPWFFGGAPDPRWKDDELNQLKTIPGNAFEAVDTGKIIH